MSKERIEMCYTFLWKPVRLTSANYFIFQQTERVLFSKMENENVIFIDCVLDNEPDVIAED